MVDPLSKLPTETVRQIFSPLNTAALTRSEATSKLWRNKLQSDSFPHQVLDLTTEKDRFARKSIALIDETESISLLHRLSIASQHPIKHLHLDLLCFWNNFCEAEEREEFGQQSIPAILSGISKISSLFMVIRLTGKLLEKLFISIPENGAGLSQENAVIFAEMILEGGFELLDSLPNMRELHFEIPFPMSLSAGGLEKVGSKKKSKKITIVGYVIEEDSMLRNLLDTDICHHLLKKINQITQRGLTSMKLDLGCLFDGGEEEAIPVAFEGLIREIKLNSTHLKSLKLTFKLDYSSLIAWDLIVECSNLSNLSIFMASDEKGVIKLRFPQTEQSSKIKHLKLETERLRLECSSENFWSWIGSSLETLSLQEIQISNNAFSSLLNANPSLNQMKLIFVNVHQSLSSTPTAVSLPNLQSLVMEGGAVPTFTGISLPVLMDLAVYQSCGWFRNREERAEQEAKDNSDLLQQLYSILSGCKSTLKTFSIQNAKGSIEESWIKSVMISESISFPKLEKLKLHSSTSDDSAWFAGIFSRIVSPSVEVIEVHFKPTFMSVFSKLLVSKSSSLVEIKVPRRFTLPWPQKQSSIVYPPISTLFKHFPKGSFPNLKYLTLCEDMVPLLGLFCQSDLPKLQELNVALNRDICSKYEITSEQLTTWLISILSSISSSLVYFKLEQTKEDTRWIPHSSSDSELSDSEHGDEDSDTRRTKPKDMFKESLEKIEGSPIITFNRLERLQVRSDVLFKFFKRCRFEKDATFVKL